MQEFHKLGKQNENNLFSNILQGCKMFETEISIDSYTQKNFTLQHIDVQGLFSQIYKVVQLSET